MRLALALGGLFLSASQVFAQPPVAPRPALCAPVAMTRMVVREVTPGLAAADPRAQPRTIHRFGATELRSETPPDLNRGGASDLAIVSEPDVWTIDLTRRLGAHAVDPGPELVVRAPILPITPDMPPRFRTLEFGCEAAFVAANAPQATQTRPWGLSQVAAFQITEGAYSLAMLMDTRWQEPVVILYSRAGQVVFAMRYDAYRNDLPESPELFAPPQGVQITTSMTATPKR